MQHLLLPESGAQLLLQVLKKTRASIRAAASSHFTHSCSCSAFFFLSFGCLHLCSPAGEEEGSVGGEIGSDLASSSNTLCESVVHSQLHVTWYLLLWFLLRLLCFQPALQLCWFSFLLFYPFARLTPARVFRYHIFEPSSCTASASTWYSPVASATKVVGETDTKRDEWVGEEMRA